MNEISECKFYVIDSVMGSGKTSSAINYINSMPSDDHFIYVAPYLSEVDRIYNSCTGSITHAVLKMYKNLFTERGEN